MLLRARPHKVSTVEYFYQFIQLHTVKKTYSVASIIVRPIIAFFGPVGLGLLLSICLAWFYIKSHLEEALAQWDHYRKK